MLYDKPIFKATGDEYLLMTIGTGMGIDVNSRVIEFNNRLKIAIEDFELDGIIDTIPGWCSIVVYYDFIAISYVELQGFLLDIYESMGEIITIKSRIIEIPVLYGTPENGEKWGPDLKAAAQLSKMTVDEAVEVHTGCNFWVGLVSFIPGLPFTRPLNKKGPVLKSKAYQFSRTYTPEGYIGLGGVCTAWYTVASEGGYSLIGYMPVPGYDPLQQLPDFVENPILVKPGDMVRYVSINRDEFDDIRQQVREHTYCFKITETEFDLKAYLEEDSNG